MKGKPALFYLLMTLLSWTPAQGGCGGTSVIVERGPKVLSAGQSFKLSCEFRCLGTQHTAQLWREKEPEGRVCLINVTSVQPNLTLVLHIDSATEADTGFYLCMTKPPHAISHKVFVQIADTSLSSPGTILSTEHPMAPVATPTIPDCVKQHVSVTGLQGQMWYWMLLGKTTILLLSLIALASKNYSVRA